jgi:hypothetical protein
MGATTVYQLPYPEAADPADVPVDLQELAAQIEAKIAPGTAAGQVPVWDNAAQRWAPAAVGPSRVISYTEKTTNVSVVAGSEAASDLVITDSARSYDGTPIDVEFFAAGVWPAAAANAEPL